MERYSDDMDFVDSTGEVIQNGSPQIMANREFWLLETDSGTPKIENVDSGGIDLYRQRGIIFSLAFVVVITLYRPVNTKKFSVNKTTKLVFQTNSHDHLPK